MSGADTAARGGATATRYSREQVAPDAAIAETHSAIVVFFGDRAYKVKKPVNLGFLDFSTAELRRIACEREVALNRRLAPDVYLGVSEIRGPAGEVCDHMVTMRRMPEDRRLRDCLERGENVGPALRELAGHLADLHETRTEVSLTHVATRDAVCSHWTAGFEQLAPYIGESVDAVVEHQIEKLALRYLEGRSELFDERIREGHVRDGHGDLQAEDIFLLDDGPRALDCLEFDDELRWGDVLLDVAFLAMDLERMGHTQVAARFLADYRSASGESWPVSLAHHYLAYRAHVRAKVEVIRSVQTGRRSTNAEKLQQLCVDHLKAGRVRLILVGGLPGTGKSTLAAELAKDCRGVVLRSDEIRRQLPDVEGQDRYSPGAIDATYRQLLDQAEALLKRGEHVVLDATWSDEVHRDLARLTGERACADLVEICCVTPPHVSQARIERRLADGHDPSEATPSVATAMANRFAPWPQARTIATDRVLSKSVPDATSAAGWCAPDLVC